MRRSDDSLTTAASLCLRSKTCSRTVTYGTFSIHARSSAEPSGRGGGGLTCEVATARYPDPPRDPAMTAAQHRDGAGPAGPSPGPCGGRIQRQCGALLPAPRPMRLHLALDGCKLLWAPVGIGTRLEARRPQPGVALQYHRVPLTPPTRLIHGPLTESSSSRESFSAERREILRVEYRRGPILLADSRWWYSCLCALCCDLGIQRTILLAAVWPFGTTLALPVALLC